MENHSHVLIAEVSADDYRKLGPFFSNADIDSEAWNQGDLKKQGIVALLQEAEIAQEGHVQRQIAVTVSKPVKTFTDYAYHFARELNQKLLTEIPASSEYDSTLVLNFLAFSLSITRVDKIIASIFEKESLGAKFGKIVVLLRNIDWLTYSKAFRQVSSSPAWRTKIWVADLRALVTVWSPENADFSPPKKISRKAFRLLLKTDKKTIYQSLIYGTNSYIGHFILHDSHVRTHYDLTQYIQRDNVWEYMFTQLLSVVGTARSLLIIGVGFETGTISKAGTQLQASLPHDVTCEFIETYDTFLPSDVIFENWAQSFEVAIVLTDIVNSGKTVEPYIKELQRSANGQSIKVFSIAKMLNSPSSICGVDLLVGVEIQRNFYTEPCILCDIEQPAINVSKAADFRRVLPDQLTPYDFWEMIYETKSLKRSDTDSRGRKLLYRIDTAKITKRYAGWLANVIRQRYAELFPKSRPDVICTVDETSGKAFAVLVARALQLSEIVVIPRRDLDRTGPSGLPRDMGSPFPNRAKVLVVDDGINKGETMRQLVNFCRTADVELLGAMVLDSRLDPTSTTRIEELMGRRPLFAIYRWPAAAL